MRTRTRPFRALDFAFDVRAPADFAALFDDAFADLAIGPGDLSGTGTPTDSLATIEVRRRRGSYIVGCRPDESRRGSAGEAVAFVIDVVNDRARASMPGVICLHAAAVATPHGAVALVGPSGSGKSTLAAALARAGHGYIADEVTSLRPEGDVVGFHRPIGLRQGGAMALGIDIPAAEDGRFDVVFPYRPPSESLRAGGSLVAVCLVQGGGETMPPTRLRPAEALVELASGAFGNAIDDDRQAFRQMSELVSRVPTARLSYASPADGVAQVLEVAATG